MATTCRLLLVSGSLRRLSTNSAALRTAQRVAPPGTEAVLYEGLRGLPPFDPDDDVEPLAPEVAALRDAVHRAAAIVFSTPEYAGALPGSFKNLLDWTIGDDQPGSIYEKPVAWVNTSPRGAAGAHGELRTVLGYAHASIIEEACCSVPVTSAMVGADGYIADQATVDRLAEVLRAVAAAAARRGS
ncbi:MAG TPA: NADPH-dependent FMN reductase [Acidimicrobiales bacterium]|nr:NADPH-dependent FMN reductase [Acidimicrobiales bacterium]